MAAPEVYPNLKITVGNDDLEIGEEGSVSGCESEQAVETAAKDVEIHREFISPLDRSRIYVNKGGAFITGLDLTSKAVTMKLIDRAERFGLEDNSKQTITQNDIDALYKSLDIELDEEKQPTGASKNIRLNAIHMRGVEEMSTNDVFDYFKEYGPASVEWINDYSCNVVWLDSEGAARALLGLSRVLVVRKKSQSGISPLQAESTDNGDKEEVIFMSDIGSDSESSDEEDDDDKLVGFKHEKKGNPKKPDEEKVEPVVPMEVESVEMSEDKEEGQIDDDAPEVPVPPGHWRLGIPHRKAKAILVRYATKDDRKLPGAEKRSQYYKKYGNPNYGGLKGLISKTRKRKFIATKQRQVVEHLSGKGGTVSVGLSFKPADDLEEERRKKPKKLRMRMCADDEEERLEKLKKKSLHKLLMEERVSLKREREVTRRHRSTVHDRLGSHSRPENAVDIIYRMNATSKDDIGNDVREEEGELMDSNVRSTISRPGSKTSSSKDKSRFDVWTRLAESMAREPEDPETNYRQDRRFSRNDLRERLSYKPASHRSSESSTSDLRSKLDKRRRRDSLSKHRSPLVIGDET